MKYHSWMLVAALLAGAGSARLAAQAKVAVINFQEALLNTADMQKESAALEAKYASRQGEIESLSQELQDISARLQSAQGDAAARLQAEGQRKQRTAQRLTEDLQSDVEFDRQNILAAGSGRMREVIQTLRVDQGLDLIVDGSGVLAHSAIIDLTAEATQAYDAKHPAN